MLFRSTFGIIRPGGDANQFVWRDKRPLKMRKLFHGALVGFLHTEIYEWLIAHGKMAPRQVGKVLLAMDEKYDNMMGSAKLTVKTYYIARAFMVQGYGAADLLDAKEDREYVVMVPGYNVREIEKNLKSWANVVESEQANDFKTMTSLQMRGVVSENFFKPITDSLR